MAGICLTMDVGGSSIKYALIDADRNLTEHGKVPTPHRSRSAHLDALAGIYQQFRGRVEGIALSYPGIIDSEAGPAPWNWGWISPWCRSWKPGAACR